MVDGMSHDAPRQASPVVSRKVTKPHWVYWSGVTSSAHLLYGKAWLRSLLSTEPTSVTVVLADPRRFLGIQQLSLDDAQAALAGLRGVRLVSAQDVGLMAPADSVMRYLAVGAPGIKPFLRLRAANPTRSIETVVTDEGISSYGTWRTRRDAWLREGGGEPRATVRALAMFGARRALTTKRWSTFRRSAGSWEVNPWVADEFRAAGVRSTPVPAAVFCSQPWVELGLVSDDEYTSFVLSVADRCRSAGLDFTLRPHPAERLERYPASLDVSRAAMPAELDSQCINASVILGASSTALLNLSAVHEVPVIRVSPPQVAALDSELSKDQASLLAHYLGAPADLESLASRLGRVNG